MGSVLCLTLNWYPGVGQDPKHAKFAAKFWLSKLAN